MAAQPGSLILREVREEDLPIFFEHQREPEANAMAAFPPRERDAFFKHWHEIVLPNGGARTVVVDGQVVGNFVSWIDGDKRLIGYWIGRAFWGRGIATRALAEFVRGFERPLWAYVATANLGSVRVLEKCGFVEVERIQSDVEELLMRY